MNNICKIEGCGPATRLIFGMCQMHYRRTKLYGDPNFVLKKQRRHKDKNKMVLFDDRVEVELTQGKVALIDIDDVDLVRQHNWYFSSSTKYAYSNTAGTSMQQFLIGKAPKGYEIDHDNRNKLDNRRANISHKTYSENNYNTIRSDNRKGVSFHKASNKYQAFIGMGGYMLYLGLFETEEVANQNRAKALKLLLEVDFDLKKFKPSWKMMRTAKADTEKRDE